MKFDDGFIMKKIKRDIKQLLPKKNSRYDQGYFDTYNPKKYVGRRPIIYRSSWEKLFMSWCENNPQVKEWGSEITAIPYYDYAGGRHTYYVDFTVLFVNGLTLLVEVKPSKDIPRTLLETRMDPVKAKNFKKWKAVKEYCKTQPNTQFFIATEKFFGKTLNK